MLNILDLEDIEMSAKAKADHLLREIEARFQQPEMDTAITIEAANLARQFDPEAARQVRRVMGGLEDAG